MNQNNRMSRAGVSTLLIAVIACFVLAAGIVSAGETIQIHEDGGGSTVELSCGDRLEVVLSANPTTGYTWEVSSLDAAVLTVSGDASFKPDSGLIGAGGRMTFSFDTGAAGRTALRLIYHRPFEKGVAPLKVFELNVTVKP